MKIKKIFTALFILLSLINSNALSMSKPKKSNNIFTIYRHSPRKISAKSFFALTLNASACLFNKVLRMPYKKPNIFKQALTSHPTVYQYMSKDLRREPI